MLAQRTPREAAKRSSIRSIRGASAGIRQRRKKRRSDASNERARRVGASVSSHSWRMDASPGAAGLAPVSWMEGLERREELGQRVGGVKGEG